MCKPGNVTNPAVCVLGLGLIGGSVLRAAVAAGREGFGYNRSFEGAAAARRVGFAASTDLNEALTWAAEREALIVLAVPMPEILAALQEGESDAVTLAELLTDAKRDDDGVDIGSAAVLAEFARRRSADREGIIDFTDRLVKLFGDQRPGVPLLRDIGLLLFDLSPTAKQAMSRLSWGFAGRTPRLARGVLL